MKNNLVFTKIIILFVCCLTLFPVQFVFAKNLEISGWIPYWSGKEAIAEARKHISDFDVIMPFVFEGQTDGTIISKAKLDDTHWKNLFRRARSKHVDILPTIAWFDSASIHSILSDPKRREQHIENIIKLVDDGNFDGIDIDYESRSANTIDYYSQFLKELKDALGRDILSCTVEARTPPDSLYATIPTTLSYSNDYPEINKYCDRIEIMAYDQQRADIKLNAERKGTPYAPVADRDWQEKVIILALKDFDKDKVHLGIPTYGRNWSVTAAPSQFKNYSIVSSLTFDSMEAIQKRENIEPERNSAGEIGFSYFRPESPFKFLDAIKLKDSSREATAEKALFLATVLKIEIPFNFISFSDATSVESSMNLAKKYGLAGVSLFSINGRNDEDIWSVID